MRKSCELGLFLLMALRWTIAVCKMTVRSWPATVVNVDNFCTDEANSKTCALKHILASCGLSIIGIQVRVFTC